jgi:predicted RNase H-like HicB family nuclease
VAAVQSYANDVLLTHDPEEGTWGATVPTLPGCVAQGDSREEALEMMRGAIQLHVASLRRDGVELFDDSDSSVPEVVRFNPGLEQSREGQARPGNALR